MRYVFFISFFLSSILQAQQLDTLHYFNKLYNQFDETSGMLSQAVKVVEDGYLVFGNYPLSTDDRRNYVRKVNKLGEEIWFKDYDFGIAQEKGVISRGGQVLQNTTGNLVLAYSYDTTGIGGRKLHKLIEIDLEGNYIQTALYGDTTQSQLSRAVVEVENGYVILGVQQNDEQVRRMCLIKVDYEFNEIWRKYFVDNRGSPYYLRKTFWDNGFLVSGFSYTDDYWGYDSHTLKLDSEGNLEWEYIQNALGSSSATTPIVPIKEENYTIGDPIEYIVLAAQDPPDSVEVYDSENILTFSKLDENGNLLFKKIYDNEEFSRAVLFTGSQVINDSTVIVSIGNNYGFADTDVLLADISTIDGEVRWVQTLQTNDELHRQDYMRDLQQTTDGGFILAGFRETPGVQRSWVVKTDSLGNTCGFANCDSLSVVEVPIVSSNNYLDIDFRIYPNPASDKIHLLFNSTSVNKVRITNSIGQTILMRDNVLSSTDIDISKLESGLYFLNFSQNGRFFSKKFVKE